MSSFNLLDMLSHCHPEKPGFTYTSTARRTFYGSRIDYLLVDKKIATHSISCQIEFPPVPDHKSLILSIKPAKQRGRGYWKLNNNILHDISFKNKIRQIFRTTVQEYAEESPVLKPQVWELCKIRFKEFTIKYSSNKAYIQKTESRETLNSLGKNRKSPST